MPYPSKYQNAGRDFDQFMDDAKNELGFESRHMAYTTVQSVFQVFRCRISVQHALDFASHLPAVIGAIFVSDWKISGEAVPFADMATMNDEVKQLRKDHNFSPDNAIQCVASVLWRHVDQAEMKKVLSLMPPEAASFWEC